MSGIPGGRFIQKGTAPHVCESCRKIIYNVWLWSDKDSRYNAVQVDCLRDGALHPTKRRGGVGTEHRCERKESAA